MKVYFGFTVAGSRSSVEAAKKIVDILQSMGHEVLTVIYSVKTLGKQTGACRLRRFSHVT